MRIYSIIYQKSLLGYKRIGVDKFAADTESEAEMNFYSNYKNRLFNYRILFIESEKSS